MSLKSESHHGNVIVSASGRPAEIKIVRETGNEVSGYESVLKHHQAVKKSLGPIGPNVRNKTWMSQDLSVYANNEYVYATFPIALSLFWGKGGKGIWRSKPLSVIFFYDSDPLSKHNGYE